MHASRNPFAAVGLMLLFGASTAGAQVTVHDTSQTVSVGGFVDSYFSWNGARPASHTNRLRNFDTAENQFVLSQAGVDVQRPAAPIGFRVAINAGTSSDMIHAGLTGTQNLLMQGYLTFLAPVGAGLTIDAGKFATHMGYETISAKDNANYSRSFLFSWAIPYYHLGVRLSYPLLDGLTVGGTVCNGWNAGGAGGGKTFGASIAFAPVPFLFVTGNWIGGPDDADTTGSHSRNVAELIIGLQPGGRLTLALDAMYGRKNAPGLRALWKGAALYARYALTDDSAVSARAEVFDDPQGGATAAAQQLRELTLTYEYRVLSNLLLRGEFRSDRSTIQAFDGSGGPGTQDHQNTFAVGGIVTF